MISPLTRVIFIMHNSTTNWTGKYFLAVCTSEPDTVDGEWYSKIDMISFNSHIVTLRSQRPIVRGRCGGTVLK